MKQAQINKIILFCRKNHVKRIKTGDLEIEFHEDDTQPVEQPVFVTSKNKIAGSIVDLDEGESPSEDEFMYMSSPYYDDLRAQRKDKR